VNKLNFVGDYCAISEGRFQVVTSIDITREWSRGNPGFSDPGLRNPVSYQVKTPIIEVLTPDEIVSKFDTNNDLKIAWINGVFRYLVEAGTLPKCELLSIKDIKANCLKAISDPVTQEEISSGDRVYFGSRRLAVQTMIGIQQSNALDLFRDCIKQHDWYPSLKIAYVGIGLLGSYDEAHNKANSWIDSRYYSAISNGWAVLAGISIKDPQKIKSYSIVKNNESRHIGLVGNRVLTQVSLVSTLEESTQFESDFILATQESKSRYYFIQNCGLLAKSILQEKANLIEGLTETFSEARKSVERGYNYKTTPKELLTLAVSAQTVEEVNFAYITASHYFQETMRASLRSHALTALAILSLDDRSIIGNLVSLSIEHHDPLSF
jgi:hypothetical protein